MILAAITLDMFAVLFGGVVALLSIYATDILKVGAEGLGIVRAAPSAGALLMVFVLAHLLPMKNAGRTLLLAVMRIFPGMTNLITLDVPKKTVV